MSSPVDDQKIAAHYAKALLENLQQPDSKVSIETVRAEFETVNTLIETDPLLMDYLANPGVASEDKKELLKSLFHKKVSAPVYSLLLLLIDNERIAVLRHFYSRFKALLDALNNTVTAEVITASTITATLEKKIQKSLQSTFGFKDVVIEHKVDPGILGGVLIKFQDKVIDGTFVGKLEAMRKQAGA